MNIQEQQLKYREHLVHTRLGCEELVSEHRETHQNGRDSWEAGRREAEPRAVFCGAQTNIGLKLGLPLSPQYSASSSLSRHIHVYSLDPCTQE